MHTENSLFKLHHTLLHLEGYHLTYAINCEPKDKKYAENIYYDIQSKNLTIHLVSPNDSDTRLHSHLLQYGAILVL